MEFSFNQRAGLRFRLTSEQMSKGNVSGRRENMCGVIEIEMRRGRGLRQNPDPPCSFVPLKMYKMKPSAVLPTKAHVKRG